MEIVGKFLLFGGLLLALISQIYIIVLAFKFRFSAGLFCLLITPIYAFFSDLHKDNKVRIGLKVWIVSLVLIVIGTFVLTAV